MEIRLKDFGNCLNALPDLEVESLNEIDEWPNQHLMYTRRSLSPPEDGCVGSP
ncbi:uncharacterized protein CPUR_01176 [Claviceps purpurea 20.1]|uniref:Uncharacterized protein n=1 Tax=Claviceps purpurea (strain 20.1) TaxID=1111077 RepID=M1VUF9_CLAP2|nr:uncharacterized protein CPUR_01176 [Claviceps purpurea 20.1]